LQERRAIESAPAPVCEHAPEAELPEPSASADRLVGVHFSNPEPSSVVAAVPASATPAGGPGFLDPILEAHFAGQVPVDPAPAPVSAPVSVAAPVVKPAAPRAASTSDWVEPSANIASAATVELYTDTRPVDVPASHGDGDAPFVRCEVCGGQAEDGDLCPTCRETFQALLEPPPALPAAEPSEPSQAVAAPAPEEMPAVSAASQSESVSVDVQQVATAAVIEDAPAVVPAAPVVPAPVNLAPSAPLAAVQPSPAIQIKVRPSVAASPAAEPAPALDGAAASHRQGPPAEAAPKPAQPRVLSPSAPAREPASGARKVAAIVAVTVALGAIGFPLSKLWLGQQTPAIVQDHDQSEPAVMPAPAVAPAPAPAPERRSLPVTAPEPVVVARAETAVPTTFKAQPVVPAAPKPAAAARAAAVKSPVKTARQPVAPPRPAAVVPASSAAVVVPAPEVAPPVPVAAPEPKPEAPAAPIGPFFELRDVSEVPRVLNRVEPQLPDDLRDRQLNEVVIVRILVTQAGHPMMVNILRRSKAGASLDDAIVAAVKKWTFAPAKRRGEAVSCWYHVGVPVANAN